MIPKTLLCLRWYAVGCILAYFGLQVAPVADHNRSKSSNNVEGKDSFLNVKPKAPFLTGNASEALSRPAIAGEHSVLPEIKTRNDLLAALMDERVRFRLLKNSEFMRGSLSSGDWSTLSFFCFYNLNWSWEDLENAVSPDFRTLVEEYQLHDSIYVTPEKAWSELLRSESQKPDRPHSFRSRGPAVERGTRHGQSKSRAIPQGFPLAPGEKQKRLPEGSCACPNGGSGTCGGDCSHKALA